MKKLIKSIAVLIVVSISLQASAQQFGIRAGFNMASFSNGNLNDDEVETGYNPGFHIGGSYEYELSDWFSIESALLLSTTGLKMSEDFFSLEYKATIYNLNSPTVAKGTFELNKSTNIYVQAGPYVGYALFGNAKLSYADIDGQHEESESIDFEDVNRFDIGITSGVGVEWNSFQIGLTYEQSLYNDYLEMDALSSVFKLSLGYNFNLN